MQYLSFCLNRARRGIAVAIVYMSPHAARPRILCCAMASVAADTTTQNIFEMAMLTTVALSGALVQFVASATIAARDALRIHLLMGAFLSLLLALQTPPEVVVRYVLAVAGIPVVMGAYEYMFGPHPAFAAMAASGDGGTNKSHMP